MTEEEFRSGNGPAHEKGDAYIKACDKVCSPNFDADRININEFKDDLKDFIAVCRHFDKYKKLLFRGKTREEVGFRHFSAHDITIADKIPAEDADLVHGIVGTITETGELAELLLRTVQGHIPDKVNAVEEAGDITWYLSRILKWSGHTFEQCFKINIDKLHGRHGETFSVERDSNRNLETEREKLEISVHQPDLLESLRAVGLSEMMTKGNGG